MLYHRTKIAGVELDLVLLSPAGRVVCVEVKSNDAGWSIADRITRTQLVRLFRAQQSLAEWLKEPVSTEIVLSGHAVEIYYLKDLL